MIKPRFIRFLFVGALNTLFSLTVYWILVFFGVHYSLAVFISNMLGILFNYKTTGRLVFESRSNKLIFKFIAVYLLVYMLSVASLKLLFYLGVDKYTGAVIISLPMAVISFYLMKMFVFNKNPEDKTNK
jgi:putative flippase GtrA